MNKLPFIGHKFDGVRVVDKNTCQFKNVCYVNIVDATNNTENSIVLENTYDEKVESHPCPKPILMSLIAILRYKIFSLILKNHYKFLSTTHSSLKIYRYVIVGRE